MNLAHLSTWSLFPAHFAVGDDHSWCFSSDGDLRLGSTWLTGINNLYSIAHVRMGRPIQTTDGERKAQLPGGHRGKHSSVWARGGVTFGVMKVKIEKHMMMQPRKSGINVNHLEHWLSSVMWRLVTSVLPDGVREALSSQPHLSNQAIAVKEAEFSQATYDRGPQAWFQESWQNSREFYFSEESYSWL